MPTRARSRNPLAIPDFDIGGEPKTWSGRPAVDRKELPVCWLKENAVDQFGELVATGNGSPGPRRPLRVPNVVMFSLPDVDFASVLTDNQEFLDRHRLLCFDTTFSGLIWKTFPWSGMPVRGDFGDQLPDPATIVGGRLISLTAATPGMQESGREQVYEFPTTPFPGFWPYDHSVYDLGGDVMAADSAFGEETTYSPTPETAALVSALSAVSARFERYKSVLLFQKAARAVGRWTHGYFIHFGPGTYSGPQLHPPQATLSPVGAPPPTRESTDTSQAVANEREAYSNLVDDPGATEVTSDPDPEALFEIVRSFFE